MSDVPPPPPGHQPPPPPPPPGNLAPPPGYAAYGTAPTPTVKVGRISGLATAISVVVAIAGLGGVLNAVLQNGLRSDAEDLIAGRITDTEFNDQLVSSSAFSVVSGLATIAAMVLVMIWMYRIASNLRAFGIPTTWHPLFAVFGWFLPPAVLYVIPFLMLREQWSKSTVDAVNGQPAATPISATKTSSENPTLWVWWLAFGIWPLAALFLSANSIVGSLGDTDAESIAQNLLDTNQAVTLLGAVIGLIAAAAWIMFVRQLSARHRQLTNER